jgi:gamma-glutamyltranspeptidase/glutathione hydrolase
MDAALTTALAQIAVQTGAGMSFAGRLTAVHYAAESGRIHAINAGWRTVRGEADPLSIPPMDQPSGRATLVPGFMAGVEELHRRFGTLPFAALFEPAIYFAEHGIPVNRRLAALIGSRRDGLLHWPETRSVFTKENGELYAEGDTLKQTQLAQTLKQVAARGADYMYRGDWAERFVAALGRAGGKMTLADLKDYQVSWSEPLRTSYRGYEVVSLGPPSTGGMATLEALNLVEVAFPNGFDHYTRSPEVLHTLIRISRAADLLGQPGTDRWDLRPNPVPGAVPTHHRRVTKEWARALWATMQTPEWRAYERRVAEAYRASGAHAAVQKILDREREALKPRNTDCSVAVDSAGNVSTIVHTINALAWGGGLFIDGVSISNSAALQRGAVAAVGPGAPVPDPLNPLLVLHGGKPILSSCTAGTFLHAATLQSLINVLDFKMDPKQAVDTPQFWQPDLSEGVFAQLVPVNEFSDDVLAKVRSLGQAIKVVAPEIHYGSRGYWVGVTIDSLTRRIRAGTSSYFNGYAVGY